MHTRPIVLIVTGLALALSTAACGGSDSPEPTDSTSTRIANPASEFCVAQGGTLDVVDEQAGQVGYCTLPDGTRVEEWEYFRANSPDATADTGTSTVETAAP